MIWSLTVRQRRDALRENRLERHQTRRSTRRRNKTSPKNPVTREGCATNQKRERQRTPENPTTDLRKSWRVVNFLRPLLPVHVHIHHFGGERPRVPDQDGTDAPFFVLRARCQWQVLDPMGFYIHQDRCPETERNGSLVRAFAGREA